MLEALKCCISSSSSAAAAVNDYTADLSSLVSAISDLSSHATQRNHDLTALVLLTKLYATAHDDGFESSAVVVLPTLTDPIKIFNLLLKIIQPKNTDIKLAVSILTLLNLKEALNILNDLISRFGYDYHRLNAVADIGSTLSAVYNKTDLRMKFEFYAVNAKWGRRFGEINISFKGYFGKHAAQLNKLFDTIVENPKCSYGLLKDFCTDFDLSLSDALLCYLRSLLRSFVPKPVQVTGDIAKTRISRVPDSLTEQLHNIADKVDDRIKLHKVLQSELMDAMSYNYDILVFLLRQLLVRDQGSTEMWQRGLDIILFLSSYDRKNEPSATESDDWKISNPDSSGLPSIAWHRLPFHCLFKSGTKLIMEIIQNELDVNTIDIWLRISESLQLNSDELCYVTVQNAVSRIIDRRNKCETVGWQIAHHPTGLLSTINSVILKINHSKLAVACGNHVLMRLLPGVDKMKCAAQCLVLAERWDQVKSCSASRESVANFRKQHKQLAVEHALHIYSLADKEYLR